MVMQGLYTSAHHLLVGTLCWQWICFAINYTIIRQVRQRFFSSYRSDNCGVPTVPIEEVQLNGTALTPDGNKAVNIQAITSVSVNGVSQTPTAGALDLDVAANLITETQWTAIQAAFNS